MSVASICHHFQYLIRSQVLPRANMPLKHEPSVFYIHFYINRLEEDRDAFHMSEYQKILRTLLCDWISATLTVYTLQSKRITSDGVPSLLMYVLIIFTMPSRINIDCKIQFFSSFKS